jgi:hypothetical protein
VLTILACLGVLWHKNCGLSQGISLFLLNTSLAFLGTSAGLSIGHAENIVGLHTAVESAIAWDWFSKLFSLVLCFFNTIENAKGIFI